MRRLKLTLGILFKIRAIVINCVFASERCVNASKKSEKRRKKSERSRVTAEQSWSE